MEVLKKSLCFYVKQRRNYKLKSLFSKFDPLSRNYVYSIQYMRKFVK